MESTTCTNVFSLCHSAAHETLYFLDLLSSVVAIDVRRVAASLGLCGDQFMHPATTAEAIDHSLATSTSVTRSTWSKVDGRVDVVERTENFVSRQLVVRHVSIV
jgi:hypothetical protein